MAERVLNLHFMGNCFSLLIHDIDECLLLDVVNDMVKGFETNGFELPKFPVLQYSYKEKIHQLKDDKTLLNMFEVIQSKAIDIWIGCLQEPNFIWTLAQKMRMGDSSQTNTQPQKIDKLPYIRAPLTNITPNLPLSPMHLHNDISPTQVSLTNEQTNNHSQQGNNDTSQTNVDPHISTLSTSCVIQKSFNSVIRPSSFPHGKKMPKSTAIKKGLWVAKGRTIQPVEVNRMVVTRTRSRPRTGQDDLNVDGYSGDSDDSEGEYEPGVMSCESSENDDELDFEEGDIQELLNQNYVDGGWEPFKTNEWFPEDSGFMTQVFKNGEVYEDADIGKIRLKVWQLFVDKDHFKDALRDYCIQEGFALVVKKADSIRYTAECADERCGWKIHASILADGHTWAIKSIKSNHICDLNLVNNPMCNCEWAASKLLDDIRANPDIRGKKLNDALWDRYGLTMATSTIYRMKAIALRIIQGGHDESYTNLPQYCDLLKFSNPGSVAFCTWAAVNQPQRGLQFRSIFVSFAAQFRGLIHGCRGLVGVDGCHLKGNYGGILLSAVSLDGNNEIFPVAVAIVDSENKTSWSWFFHHLKQILTEGGRNDWTIMSDRQKGIDPSLDSIWPQVPRRYCARHLCKNFKTDYPGLLMHKLFWGVINAYSPYSFRKALEQVKVHGGLGALKWFKDIGPMDRWTRWRFDSTLKSDETTNNFVESFNSTIGVDRSYPVLTLLEGVRRIAMVRHATRQQLAEQWPEDGICPNVLLKLRVLTKDSRMCIAYPSGRGAYEVHDGKARLPVSITSMSCACGRWQISGIPCKHGIKAILHEGKQPTYYVSDWFSVSRYKQAYNGNISPVPDQDQWPHDDDAPKLIAPTMKRSIGRPSRNRRREEGEQRKGKRSTTVTCSKCKAPGHNAATCKGGPTARELAEQQGNKQPTTTKRKMSKRPREAFDDTEATNLIESLMSGNVDK